jgi:glycosyltransferase involved in cell wall biosynthesis
MNNGHCVAGTKGLDEKGAVLWLWDAEDLREALLFHPDLLTLAKSANAGGTGSDLQRVVAIAGQPIQGGRDLLLSTSRSDVSAVCDATGVNLLITNTPQARQEMEDGGFKRPCVQLDLYESVEVSVAAHACERGAVSSITYAYLVGKGLSKVDAVIKAFAMAFGSKTGAELLIYADEPASVRSLIEHRPQDAPGRVRVEHCSELSAVRGRDCWPFDVLIIDDAPDRLQPISFEAALRSKQTVAIPTAGRREAAVAPDEDPSFALAAEMLVAARRLTERGSDAERNSARPRRAPRPANLARRLRWTTQGPSGELLSDGLSGVGWVTRWNVKCGVGDHAAQQIRSNSDRHVVLAPREDSQLSADDLSVFRCWSLGLEANGFEEAAGVVFRERLACVVIHFNWGFFNAGELGRFIRSIRSGGRAAILDMHSTTSHRAEPGLRLADFADCFNSCDRVLVHQPADAERVRAVTVDARVAIEPLGVTIRQVARAKLEAAGVSLIACFGFCLPNKGIEELVLAIWILRQSQEDVRLLLLNAEHPAPQSRQTVDEVRQLITRLDLSDAVTFVTDYLEDAKCMDMLSQASLIVNPYQQTGESASAAVRFALASTVPVLVTPLPIFDDLGEAVFRAEGTSPADLAKAIRATLTELKLNSQAAAHVEKAAFQWREVHDLRVQTSRIIGIGESIRRNRRVDDWLRVGAC